MISFGIRLVDQRRFFLAWLYFTAINLMIALPIISLILMAV